MTTHELLQKIKMQIKAQGTNNVLIASQANITKNRINAIFAGNTPLHVKELIAISDVLGVHPCSWFNGATVVNEPQGEYNLQIVERYKEMARVYKELADGYKKQLDEKNEDVKTLRSRIDYLTIKKQTDD
jgi:transcriptional regulator with XRE-family HTH domain